MEKFVIQGGDAALRARSPPPATRTRPCRSSPPACSPRRSMLLQRAADPRHRGPDRAARAARRRGRLGRATTACGSAPRRHPRSSVDEELSSRIRASFLLAGPLLARFGEARMPPPGGDFIGRRRLDPHLDAFARPRRPDRGRPLDRAQRARRRPAGLRDLHGRAVGDGDRERADGRGADARADDDLQRRLRAARPGPRAAADEDGRRRSTGSART